MKADLHVHTKFSYDGLSSPEEAVRAAIEKNIDCLCITDHGEIKGAVEAMKFAFDKDILIIPGIEILTRSGDVLGINVKKIIPDKLSAEKTIEEIKRQGGLAVVPHPFDWPIAGFWGGAGRLRGLDLDAVEIFNASVVFGASNKKAFDFSRNNNFSFSAGSDSHRPEYVGRGYIETSDKISSIKDLLEAVKKKRVKVGGEPLNLWETFKNGWRADVREMVKFYLLRWKNKKINSL